MEPPHVLFLSLWGSKGCSTSICSVYLPLCHNSRTRAPTCSSCLALCVTTYQFSLLSKNIRGCIVWLFLFNSITPKPQWVELMLCFCLSAPSPINIRKFDIENLMSSSFPFSSSIESIVHVLEDRTSLFNYFLTQYLAFVCEKDELIDTCLSLFFSVVEKLVHGTCQLPWCPNNLRLFLAAVSFTKV